VKLTTYNVSGVNIWFRRVSLVCLHGVYRSTLPSPPSPDVWNAMAHLVEALRYERVAGSIRGGVIEIFH